MLKGCKRERLSSTGMMPPKGCRFILVKRGILYEQCLGQWPLCTQKDLLSGDWRSVCSSVTSVLQNSSFYKLPMSLDALKSVNTTLNIITSINYTYEHSYFYHSQTYYLTY